MYFKLLFFFIAASDLYMYRTGEFGELALLVGCRYQVKLC